MKIYTVDTKSKLISLELSFHQWVVVSRRAIEDGWVMNRFDLHYTVVHINRSCTDPMELLLRLMNMGFDRSLMELRWTL